MATVFTVGSGDYARGYKNTRIQHFPEAASQTFKRGEVVIGGAAGVENRVAVAADNPTSRVLGIAAADASGVTGAQLPVWLATPEAEFIFRTISTDPVDFTDIGTLRAVEKDATNVIWVVDTSDAANDSVVVLQYLHPETKNIQTVEGDSSVFVVVKFVPAATIWSGTV